MSKITKDELTKATEAKEKYRVTNWATYNKALVKRGNITIYLSEEALENWYDDGSTFTVARFFPEKYQDKQTLINSINEYLNNGQKDILPTVPKKE